MRNSLDVMRGGGGVMSFEDVGFCSRVELNEANLEQDGLQGGYQVERL